MSTLTQPLSRAESLRDMKIGLFIPCYIDLVYPEVGIATLELLERFGLDVDYPLTQTCCGQPMSNSGDEANAAAAERLFVENFKPYDCIVGPAGSCVKQVRHHFDTIEQTDDVQHVRQNTFELDDRSLINYTMMSSSILYFQRNTTGAALISSKY